MTILIGLGAFVSTLLGGLFALRFKDRLHLILGFSAGAILGVAFFDLIPEAINLSNNFWDPSFVLTIAAAGFFCYMILDRTIILHGHAPEEGVDSLSGTIRGKFGAGSLSVHSFLDGVAIGLAFQISAAIGAVITIAVLVHDFSDGINTVNLILKNRGDKKLALKWLLTDASAPVLGIFSTMFFTLSEVYLGLVLAAFSGFFLYIGASDLLPESHHRHPTRWTTIITLAGAMVLYLAIKLANI